MHQMRKGKEMKENYPRKKNWCDFCDKNIVAKGKKCSHCGKKEKIKKIRYKSTLRPNLFTDEEIEQGYHKMARKRNGAIE